MRKTVVIAITVDTEDIQYCYYKRNIKEKELASKRLSDMPPVK
jgi:hypothetical protein